MNTKAQAARPLPPRPYLRKIELEAPIKAVRIRVIGKYAKRADKLKNVYDEDYDALIDVPENWNIGHVKLQANRYIRKELLGVRVRTWEVDRKHKPEPVTDREYVVQDFISDMGLNENRLKKLEWMRRRDKAREQAMAVAAGTYTPPPFSDDTQYDPVTGLPPLQRQVADQYAQSEDDE